MARLTYAEKFKIMEAVAAGIDHTTIAEELKRTPETIQKYIENDMQEMIRKINPEAKNDDKSEINSLRTQLVELQQLQEAKLTETNGIEILPEVVVEVIYKLRGDGVKEDDARHALNVVERQLTERIDDPSRLRVLCLRVLNLHKSMITSAVGGRSGVTAMTQAASQIADHKKSNYKPANSANPHIFRPKNNDVI